MIQCQICRKIIEDLTTVWTTEYCGVACSLECMERIEQREKENKNEEKD
jgi:hypothetical protein